MNQMSNRSRVLPGGGEDEQLITMGSSNNE